MQPARLYTEPKICPKDPKPADIKKDWVINVRFYETASGTWKQILIKKGINKIKNFRERLAHAKSLRDAVAEELARGWTENAILYNTADVDHPF